MESFEQGSDMIGILWLLHGVWLEGGGSRLKKSSAFKVQVEEMKHE